MKKLIGLIAICASLAVLALLAQANVALPTNGAEQAQDQCTDENKAAWYKTFIDNYKPNATSEDEAAKKILTAYDAAKKYLATCAKEDTPQTQYLKKYVVAYEKDARPSKLRVLLFTDKKYAEAYALGKEILADEPENVMVLMQLGYGGYLAATSKVNTFNADATSYAKKAIQLIESGKTPEKWDPPFSGKDEALGFLNYTIGLLTFQKAPADALPYLIKAAQFESKLKKVPATYYYIAAAYENGPYATMSADYKKYAGKDETPESKLALENINQVVDRMIDAYARAVALASDPKDQASKTEWMQSLSTWYKYRHNQSDAGLNEMIASVLSKPLPPQPTLLTSLPASGPASTPASGSVNSASGSTSAAGAVTNKPATASSSSASTAKTNTAENPTPPASAKPSATPKPSSSPTPTKPRSRRNHRRG